MSAMVDPRGIRPGRGNSAGGRRLARRSQSSTAGGSPGTVAGSWTPAGLTGATAGAVAGRAAGAGAQPATAANTSEVASQMCRPNRMGRT
jgi:hypothetical protein